MKKTTNLIFILLVTLLVSCVSEDDVFVEPFVEVEQTTLKTPVITSFLNEEFIANTVNSENCFKFNYPITVSSNTGQSYSITNFEGLRKTALSQSKNSHITSISFPIRATVNNELITLNTVNDFKAIFNTCNIPTLKSKVLANTDFCFEFSYPMTLITSSKTEQIINSSPELKLFIENQELNYVPQFVFPLSINDNDIVINNCFELYEFMNLCDLEECSEIFISYQQSTTTNSYTFETSSEADTLTNFEWHINDILINKSTQSIDHQFTTDGFYNICAKAKTDNCRLLQTDCIFLEVSIDDCSDLYYEQTELGDFAYEFSLPEVFEEKYPDYSWEIDGLIQLDFTNTNLSYTFQENSTSEVCIFIETPNCPNGYIYCQTIDNSSID